MVRLVVTDMDNTLYSWVDYIVPAVESMVDAICRATQFPRIRVVQALKEVYTKYESNEYPFALQESSLFLEFAEFGSFDKLVIQPAREAFSAARRKYMRPYPGVLDTLQALKARGVPVVALTDAPRNPAEQRVKRLGIDSLLAGLYTLPGFDFPKDERGEALIAPDILLREERGHYRAACPVTELPRHYEKPNPEGLLQISRAFGVPPAQMLVVGDSVKKDVALAKEVGALDCWAEYGTYVSVEYRERLDIISAKAITLRHAASVLEGDAKGLTPTHALSSFAGLLKLIE
jgi:phosphoglycolate phosphatase